jgi:hypothetical protein
MEPVPRHQCLVYHGDPSAHLAGLALLIRQKLDANYRCLYLNNPAMVAGIRAYLTSTGLNVSEAIIRKRLILSSGQDHLVNNAFDPKRMLDMLKETHDAALKDGFVGLWASGDMAWEFGPARDFATLVEYERALERFFRTHSTICGICQYHADVLPDAVVQDGLAVHPALYINETLSRLNPRYVAAA